MKTEDKGKRLVERHVTIETQQYMFFLLQVVKFTVLLNEDFVYNALKKKMIVVWFNSDYYVP